MANCVSVMTKMLPLYKFGQIRHLFGQKTTHLLDLTVSPNGTSRPIYLPEIRFAWGNKGDVHRVLLYHRQKIGTAIVHCYFFSLAGPRDKQFVFAIPAKLGLTTQMDVGP